MKTDRYVIGVDFGSDTVRSLVVDARTGEQLALSVTAYPRWQAGLYCDGTCNRYRQHPLDYLESLETGIRETLAACGSEVARNVCGISFDTTASTPCLTDRTGVPLALDRRFAEHPDAMFVLWKDHTALEEAELITQRARRWKIDYTRYSGGSYSCEWVWAKMLHCLRHTPDLIGAAYAWVEHCDWISALLAGDTTPETIARSRCAAGHKAMWHETWGGLPSAEFLEAADPLLALFRNHLYRRTATADTRAGSLCPEWAQRLGLKAGIAVGVGAVDCHVGAVGAGIAPGTLVKVVGTSTCDIAVADYEQVGTRIVRGICGQTDGSVLPGRIGFEAGQAAFGDLYAWLRRVLAWPLKLAGNDPATEAELLDALSAEAARIPLTEDDPVALDWHNGHRSPDADPRLRGAIEGLTLATTAPALFKTLVEATAFGSRAIRERIVDEGIPVERIVAVGGIASRAPYVMQTLADVMGVPIRVPAGGQACALGAAIFAAVVAGIHPSVEAAQRCMCPAIAEEYNPDPRRRATYDKLYARYKRLGEAVARE